MGPAGSVFGVCEACRAPRGEQDMVCARCGYHFKTKPVPAYPSAQPPQRRTDPPTIAELPLTFAATATTRNGPAPTEAMPAFPFPPAPRAAPSGPELPPRTLHSPSSPPALPARPVVPVGTWNPPLPPAPAPPSPPRAGLAVALVVVTLAVVAVVALLVVVRLLGGVGP